MVTIRLARRGRKNSPSYAIVVAASKKKRDGKFIEKLGCYDPVSKVVVLSEEKFRSWKEKGATTSGAVGRLLRVKRT